MKIFSDAILCLKNQPDRTISSVRHQTLVQLADEVAGSEDAKNFAQQIIDDCIAAVLNGKLQPQELTGSLALRMFTAGIRVGIEMEKQEL